MATFKSVQVTNLDASPMVPLDARDSRGVERILWFSAESIVLAQNDFIQLCKVPAGSRIVGGRVAYDAFGASVTMDIGDGTTENLFLSAADVSAAGAQNFADTLVLNFGLKTANGFTLTMKLEGANPNDNVTIEGFVRIVEPQ